jgi:uncharacterized membrane protein YgaE (UPF0421/DUF939 family)
MPFYTANEVRDIAERAISTALQAFLAIFIVSDLSTLESAGTAALAAAVSVVQRAATARLARPTVAEVEDPHL